MEVVNFEPPESQQVYSQALFKTILPAELKFQLNKHGLSSASDSYHLMTLKLQLQILKVSKGPSQLIDNLDEDIQKQSRVRCNYKCCVQGCPFMTGNHWKYQLHFKSVHGRSSHSIMCQLHGCEREFVSVVTLRKHIEVQHWKHESSVAKRQNVLVEQLVQMKCLCNSCGRQTVSSLQDLKNHLLSHFEKCEEVSCIFSGCMFSSDNRGSMRSHFSRKHKKQDVDALKKRIVVDSQDVQPSTAAEVETFIEPNTSVEEMSFDEEECDEPDSKEIDEVFMKSLAISINTWMNISGVAYTTVNQIVKEIFNSYGKGAEVTKSRVKMLMQNEGLSQAIVNKILAAVEEDDPFKQAKEELESEYKRKKYIKGQFPNVQPVTIQLSSVNDESYASYQYVPLTESLKVLLQDETYIKQQESDPYYPEDGQLKDARDGEGMKNNPFFKANPGAVPLLLFQDELGKVSIKA